MYSEIYMNVSILYLNYVIKGSVIKRLPIQFRSWSCITLRKSKTLGHHQYFFLKQTVFSCSKQRQLLPHYIKTESQILCLCSRSCSLSFCTPPHALTHTGCLAKMRQSPLIASSFCLTENDVQSAVGSVEFCLLLSGGLLPALMGHGGSLAHLHREYIIKRML